MKVPELSLLLQGISNSKQNLYKNNRTDKINLLVLICFWLFMIILVNPIGDFPIDDDWAYGKTVKTFIESGYFEFSDWTATNLLTQVFWGSLFSLPFGFSFSALRISTLFLGLLGVLSVYGLLRELKINFSFSFIGALLIAINPLYFAYSNSFMSDVPFFGLSMLSFYFFLRGLNKDNWYWIFLGTFFSCLSILNRQVGIAIPIVFFIAYIAKNKVNIGNVSKSILPFVVGILTQLSYQHWLKLTMQNTATHGLQINLIFESVLKGNPIIIWNFIKNSFYSMSYIGLFILPILILTYPHLDKIVYRQSRKTKLIVVCLSCFVFALIFAKTKQLMPYLGNIFPRLLGLASNLSPLAQVAKQSTELNNLFISNLISVIITVASLLGAIYLIPYLTYTFSRMFVKDNNRWIVLFIVSFVVIYFLPLSIMGYHQLKVGSVHLLDRYLLPLIPFVIMLVSLCIKDFDNQIKISSQVIIFAIMLIIVNIYFTIGSTHDLLSWNRSRWLALNNLTDRSHIKPSQIDGGFEFNGWYLYDWNFKPVTGKSPWWVIDDEYLISSGPVTGYQEIARYPVDRWLPFGDKYIFVLYDLRTKKSLKL